MLDNLQKALVEALQDEYKARETYRLVISKAAISKIMNYSLRS